MKTCSKCGETKPRDGFSKNKRAKDGLTSKCKDCVRRYYEENREQVLEAQRRYREENREQVREAKRRYREENREQVREAQRRYYEENREAKRRYYEENRERLLEADRRYYEENREQILEAKRRYREENREQRLEYDRRYHEENREQRLEAQRRYRKENPEVDRRAGERRRARKKNLPAEDIDWREVGERDNWICGICSEPVDPNEPTSNFRSGDGYNPMGPSLDHIIPYADFRCPGHVWSNVQISHHHCNISKQARVEEEALLRLLEEKPDE